MIVKSLALSDFRNYDLQELSFHHGINIFYGDNAQGKTNILEGIYLCMTNKSYRGSHEPRDDPLWKRGGAPSS